jgi:hypothetical protein
MRKKRGMDEPNQYADSVLNDTPSIRHVPNPKWLEAIPVLGEGSESWRLPFSLARARAGAGPRSKPAGFWGGGVAEFFPECITPSMLHPPQGWEEILRY